MTIRYLGAAARCGAMLLAATPAAQEVTAPKDFHKTRGLIQKIVAQGELPSVSVVAIRGGEIVWAEGLGFADIATRRPATPDTVYPVGRVSEIVTATGLMLLVDRDVIDLDVPINDYLPGAKLRFLAGGADAVTVEAIMQHGGGLPWHSNYFEANQTVPPLEETLRHYGIKVGSINSHVTRNVGYVALARVIEGVADQPWDQFLKRELFDPLAMRATGLAASNKDAATIYRKDLSESLAQFVPLRSDNPASDGLWSSAADVGRFLLLHLQDGEIDGKRLYKRRHVRRMRLDLDRQDRWGQGMGWRIGPWLLPDYFYLDVSTSHAAGRIRGYPRSGDGYVLLTNGPPRALRDIEQRLIVDLGHKAGVNWGTAVGVGGGREAAPIGGAWKGTVHLPSGTAEVELQIGKEHSKLSVAGETVHSTASRASSFDFWATFAPDTHLPGIKFRAVPRWHFDLRRVGDALTGLAYAEAEGRFKLAHLVELRPER